MALGRLPAAVSPPPAAFCRQSGSACPASAAGARKIFAACPGVRGPGMLLSGLAPRRCAALRTRAQGRSIIGGPEAAASETPALPSMRYPAGAAPRGEATR